MVRGFSRVARVQDGHLALAGEFTTFLGIFTRSLNRTGDAECDDGCPCPSLAIDYRWGVGQRLLPIHGVEVTGVVPLQQLLVFVSPRAIHKSPALGCGSITDGVGPSINMDIGAYIKKFACLIE